MCTSRANLLRQVPHSCLYSPMCGEVPEEIALLGESLVSLVAGLRPLSGVGEQELAETARAVSGVGALWASVPLVSLARVLLPVSLQSILGREEGLAHFALESGDLFQERKELFLPDVYAQVGGVLVPVTHQDLRVGQHRLVGPVVDGAFVLESHHVLPLLAVGAAPYRIQLELPSSTPSTKRNVSRRTCHAWPIFFTPAPPFLTTLPL
ncbi:hypothetical protein CDAR_459161 [Caerostris darwini]|uniref:Uncharacterized protein n=1 Tax=Caerostris darwini TaxID=1538125 RepID=A0AAV4M645_9ARAC|nr:hypothetical protein CDAR_459161 [Caerostris darwini]